MYILEKSCSSINKYKVKKNGIVVAMFISKELADIFMKAIKEEK